MTAQTATPRPAGRGRLTKLDRRKLLLDAANEVFAEQGFHKASVEEIAEHAGVSKPVLYQHFPSKLELYLTVLDQHVGELMLRVRQAIRASTNNHDRLIEAVRVFFDVIDTNTRGYRLLFSTDLLQPEVRTRIQKATDACVDAVFDIVRHDSGLELYHAKMIAVNLVGLIHVSAQHWQDSGKPIPKEEAIMATVAFAWGGLARVPKIEV
ncbi:MAG: TetR/AcrR family transcriptional regulator [Segniliparus sp.]|uniref:TetR/AcrR family transcriptional regulator n=1 Tax=Segniliparus sp. TaxID=2804064 RepID=UPI003F39528F